MKEKLTTFEASLFLHLLVIFHRKTSMPSHSLTFVKCAIWNLYARKKKKYFPFLFVSHERENFIWMLKSVCHYMRKHLPIPTLFFSLDSYLASSLTLSFHSVSHASIFVDNSYRDFLMSQLIWDAISKYDDVKIIHFEAICRNNSRVSLYDDNMVWSC